MNSVFVLEFQLRKLLLLLWNVILLSINKILYYEIGHQYSEPYLIINILVTLIFIILLFPHYVDIDVDHKSLTDTSLYKKSVINLNRSCGIHNKNVPLTLVLYKKNIRIITKKSYLIVYANIINNKKTLTTDN